MERKGKRIEKNLKMNMRNLWKKWLKDGKKEIKNKEK